jgi:hypothetical protein
MKEKRIVHLINDAKQQGAVLTLADLSAIMLVNRSTLSVRTKKYQKDTGTLLPTAGNTLDIGPGITHKRDVVELYAKSSVRTYYPECIPLNSKEVNIEGTGN